MLKLPSVQIIFVYNINNIFCAHSDPEILREPSQKICLRRWLRATSDNDQPHRSEIRAVNYTIGERKGRLGSGRSFPCWLLSPPHFVSFRFVSLVQPSSLLFLASLSWLPATKSSFRRCYGTENRDKGDYSSQHSVMRLEYSGKMTRFFRELPVIQTRMRQTIPFIDDLSSLRSGRTKECLF